MKKICPIFCILLIVAAVNSNSQIFEKTRFGIGAALTTGVNEAKTNPLNLGGRIMGRIPVSDLFTGEIGIGYLTNKGKTWTVNEVEYKTTITPIDIKLLFTPISNESWNPYIFAGAGFFNFDAASPSPIASPDAKLSGWNVLYKFGAGIEKSLSDNWSVDLHFSGNKTFMDNLNGEHDNINDGFWNIALSIVFSPFSNSNKDSDGDGLPDKLEKEIGTDFNNPDTDGDGLTDGEEYNSYKTDPLKADTDGDGLKDGEEVKVYKTNPLKTDTDDDNLTDGDEISKYKTNPNNPDSDGDGIKDNDEIFTYKTNPNNPDTDGDGLKDGDEVFTYKTKPLDPDTDGDGLSDGQEVSKYKTNPLKADTDNGTADDGIEVKRGTNPLDPKDDIAPKKEVLKAEIGKAMVLEGIEFETGKSTILPESENTLMKALNTLTENPEITVQIQGHTDNAGKKNKNMKLSKDRADAVKNWLVGKGVDDNRITTAGFGPDKPLVPNNSPENMKKNRRIEFVRIR